MYNTILFNDERNKNVIKFDTEEKINEIKNFIPKFKEKIFNKLLNPKFYNISKIKNYIKILLYIENRFDNYLDNELNKLDIKDNNKLISEFKNLINDIIEYLIKIKNKLTIIDDLEMQIDFDYMNHLKQFLINNERLNKYYHKKFNQDIIELNKITDEDLQSINELFSTFKSQQKQKEKIKQQKKNKTKTIKEKIQQLNDLNFDKKYNYSNIQKTLNINQLINDIIKFNKKEKIKYSDFVNLIKKFYFNNLEQQIINVRFKNIDLKLFCCCVIQKYNEILLKQLCEKINTFGYESSYDSNKLKIKNYKTNKFITFIISELNKLKIKKDIIKNSDYNIIINFIENIFPNDIEINYIDFIN